MSEQYTVTEVCPNCSNEVTMTWNTAEDGYRAFCPYCGKRLMLCDECRHSELDKHGNACGVCNYDSKTDTCKYNQSKKENAIMNAKAEVFLREGICEYNEAARRYNDNTTQDNEHRAKLRRRYLTGFCDCMKSLGYEPVFVYEDAKMYAEIEAYMVTDGSQVLCEGELE